MRMLVEMRNMRVIVWKNNTTVQIQINLLTLRVLYIGQAFFYSPENAFYILINKYNSLSDICLNVHH